MAGSHPAYADMPEDSVITNGFWLGKSAGFSIRPYRNADRAKIRHICCETGFLGNPIDAIFCDRELFADLMANPYLDYAEDWAHVATHNGRVVGYLLGAPPSFDRYLVYAGSAATLRMLLKYPCPGPMRITRAVRNSWNGCSPAAFANGPAVPGRPPTCILMYDPGFAAMALAAACGGLSKSA